MSQKYGDEIRSRRNRNEDDDLEDIRDDEESMDELPTMSDEEFLNDEEHSDVEPAATEEREVTSASMIHSGPSLPSLESFFQSEPAGSTAPEVNEAPSQQDCQTPDLPAVDGAIARLLILERKKKRNIASAHL
jgi:hypothetical protein